MTETQAEQWDTSIQIVATGGVTLWTECEALLADPEATEQTSSVDEALEKTFDGLLQVLEVEFECQGLCTPGDFWLYREVSEGPPHQGCMISIKHSFNSAAFGATIVMLIATFIDLLLFGFMFTMCKSDEDEPSTEEEP